MRTATSIPSSWPTVNTHRPAKGGAARGAAGVGAGGRRASAAKKSAKTTGRVYTVHMRPARERILKAAERIYRKAGVDALSIRRVAAAVDLTPMAIYRHFRDKDALIDALVAA